MLERGVRQDGNLSPYLFVLAMETLAIAIRQNSDIKGITIGREETKLLQYVDDTTATLSDRNSAVALFKLLDSFKSVSDLMINCAKTEGMWIGSARHSKSKPFNIKWPDEPIKAPGVYFTYDIKLLYEKNFIEKLDSIKKLINICLSRGLSLYGKVTVIKSLLRYGSHLGKVFIFAGKHHHKKLKPQPERKTTVKLSIRRVALVGDNSQCYDT